MSGAAYFARISTTHDVHHAVVATEMFVFLAILNIDGVLYAFSTFHCYVHIGVAHDFGVGTISTTEDTEMWRTYLIVYLFPLVALE